MGDKLLSHYLDFFLIRQNNNQFYMNWNKNTWKRLSKRAKWLLGLGVAALIVMIVLLFFKKRVEPTQEVNSPPFVRVQSLEDLAQESLVEQSGVVKPAISGPLVARTGGRVTAIMANIGQTVGAGSTVVEIDGQHTANPTRAGAVGAAESLAAFDAVKNAALKSAEAAVEIAEINLQSAQQNRPLTTEQAAVARRLADVSVEQTRLALIDARDLGADAAIRAADIANKQAQLSQDQATVSRQLANQQGSISIDQAKANLASARASRQRTAAELTSQRVQLQTQFRVAQEQLEAQQVSSPVNGSITSLTVLPGDYVTPGQVIGEVAANEGAYVRLQVSNGIQNQLAIGRIIPIHTTNQSFTGTITRLASLPNSTTGLWQVDIFITSTPKILKPNQTVTVSLPSSNAAGDTRFIPLDALNVRQQGIFVLTVESDNRVAEHEVTIVGYSGEFAEVESNIAPHADIIIEGGRTLRAGDLVSR